MPLKYQLPSQRSNLTLVARFMPRKRFPQFLNLRRILIDPSPSQSGPHLLAFHPPDPTLRRVPHKFPKPVMPGNTRGTLRTWLQDCRPSPPKDSQNCDLGLRPLLRHSSLFGRPLRDLPVRILYCQRQSLLLVVPDHPRSVPRGRVRSLTLFLRMKHWKHQRPLAPKSAPKESCTKDELGRPHFRSRRTRSLSPQSYSALTLAIL